MSMTLAMYNYIIMYCNTAQWMLQQYVSYLLKKTASGGYLQKADAWNLSINSHLPTNIYFLWKPLGKWLYWSCVSCEED